MTKPRKAKIAGSLLVPIVGDAAVAGPIADGRLLPILILDTGARPEIAELIRIHAYLPAGDAVSQWGSSRDDEDHVLLQLTFVQPMEVELALLFSIERQAILVETMLRGGAVYLQVGVAGDRLSTTLDAQRMLVELPESGFGRQWEKLLLDRMTLVMSRRLGVRRRDGRPAAQAVIAEMRKLARLRLTQ